MNGASFRNAKLCATGLPRQQVQERSGHVTQLISINCIRPRPDARPIDGEAVAEIADSVCVVGQLKAVLVRPMDSVAGDPVYELIAGNHRLQALILLGKTEIECKIVRLDNDQALLAMLAENLFASKLTFSQRAKYAWQYKQAHLKLNPETRRGLAGALARKGMASDNLSFAAQRSRQAGVSRRTVERDAELGEKISSQLLDVVFKTCLDSRVELEALSELPADEQEELARQAAAGETVSARPNASSRRPGGRVKGAARAVDAGKVDAGGDGEEEGPAHAGDMIILAEQETVRVEPKGGDERDDPVRPVISASLDPELTEAPVIQSPGERWFTHAVQAGLEWLEREAPRDNPKMQLAHQACLAAARIGKFEEQILREVFETAGRHLMKFSIRHFEEVRKAGVEEHGSSSRT